jgi:hypothetical protein
MKHSIFFALALISVLSFSCKKDNGSSDDEGSTKITTLEVAHQPADGVYGEEYTFKLQFEELGEVTEYGIIYKVWIGDETQKEPLLSDAGTQKLPFGASPSPVGTTETKQITLRYADFNDANYRAYAVTPSGKIIYGEILYISFT